MAAPMPLDAPVTTATLPLSRFMTNAPFVQDNEVARDCHLDRNGTALFLFSSLFCVTERDEWPQVGKNDCRPGFLRTQHEGPTAGALRTMSEIRPTAAYR